MRIVGCLTWENVTNSYFSLYFCEAKLFLMIAFQSALSFDYLNLYMCTCNFLFNLLEQTIESTPYGECSEGEAVNLSQLVSPNSMLLFFWLYLVCIPLPKIVLPCLLYRSPTILCI